jgi:hypothetical protein
MHSQLARQPAGSWSSRTDLIIRRIDPPLTTAKARQPRRQVGQQRAKAVGLDAHTSNRGQDERPLRGRGPASYAHRSPWRPRPCSAPRRPDSARKHRRSRTFTEVQTNALPRKGGQQRNQPLFPAPTDDLGNPRTRGSRSSQSPTSEGLRPPNPTHRAQTLAGGSACPQRRHLQHRPGREGDRGNARCWGEIVPGTSVPSSSKKIASRTMDCKIVSGIDHGTRRPAGHGPAGPTMLVVDGRYSSTVTCSVLGRSSGCSSLIWMEQGCVLMPWSRSAHSRLPGRIQPAVRFVELT